MGEAATSLWNFAVCKLRFKLISPNEDKDKKKASPASASVGQDDGSPEVGSSKYNLYLCWTAKLFFLEVHPVRIC